MDDKGKMNRDKWHLWSAEKDKDCACGVGENNYYYKGTYDREEVTCGNCKRTKEYRYWGKHRKEE